MSRLNAGKLSQLELGIFGTKRIGNYSSYLDLLSALDANEISLNNVGNGRIIAFTRGKRLTNRQIILILWWRYFLM